jgi:hypothetical protein
VASRQLLEGLYDAIWFAIAVVAAMLLLQPVKQAISSEFYRFLAVGIFIVFTYFRFTAFMMRSLVLQNVWVKIGFFILNIPLFFFLLNQYFKFIDVFDDYDYTLDASVFQHIHSGTELETLMYLKRLTVFAGILPLFLILLFQARIIYAVFKFRLFDKYL